MIPPQKWLGRRLEASLSPQRRSRPRWLEQREAAAVLIQAAWRGVGGRVDGRRRRAARDAAVRIQSNWRRHACRSAWGWFQSFRADSAVTIQVCWRRHAVQSLAAALCAAEEQRQLEQWKERPEDEAGPSAMPTAEPGSPTSTTRLVHVLRLKEVIPGERMLPDVSEEAFLRLETDSEPCGKAAKVADAKDKEKHPVITTQPDHRPAHPTHCTGGEPRVRRFAESPTGDNWVYLDNDGTEQGPFTTEQMKGWFVAGYMQPTRMVKPVGGTGDFVAMSTVPDLTTPAAVPPGMMMFQQPDAAPAVAPGPIVVPPGKNLGEVKNWIDEKGFGFIIPDGALLSPASARCTSPPHTLHGCSSPPAAPPEHRAECCRGSALLSVRENRRWRRPLRPPHGDPVDWAAASAHQGDEGAVRAGHRQGRPPMRGGDHQLGRLADRERSRAEQLRRLRQRRACARRYRHEGHGRCAAVVSAPRSHGARPAAAICPTVLFVASVWFASVIQPAAERGVGG